MRGTYRRREGLELAFSSGHNTTLVFFRALEFLAARQRQGKGKAQDQFFGNGEVAITGQEGTFGPCAVAA